MLARPLQPAPLCSSVLAILMGSPQPAESLSVLFIFPKWVLRGLRPLEPAGRKGLFWGEVAPYNIRKSANSRNCGTKTESATASGLGAPETVPCQPLCPRGCLSHTLRAHFLGMSPAIPPMWQILWWRDCSWTVLQVPSNHWSFWNILGEGETGTARL